jgi:hypothetical protein
MNINPKSDFKVIQDARSPLIKTKNRRNECSFPVFLVRPLL